MILPDLPELAASAVERALRSDAVVAGDRAMLLAIDVVDGAARGATRLLDATPLERAVAEGRMLLALSETPRTALCYLALIAEGGEQRVGLQVDVRGDGPRIASFGAPLAVQGARPVASGELWALNDAARDALDR